MSYSNENESLGIIYFITICIAIFSGYVAWNWIEPKSFFGFIGFMIVWSILSKIGHVLGLFIVALLKE